MAIDLELAVPEHCIEVMFGARAFGFALRQWITTNTVHCLVWSELPH